MTANPIVWYMIGMIGVWFFLWRISRHVRRIADAQAKAAKWRGLKTRQQSPFGNLGINSYLVRRRTPTTTVKMSTQGHQHGARVGFSDPGNESVPPGTVNRLDLADQQSIASSTRTQQS